MQEYLTFLANHHVLTIAVITVISLLLIVEWLRLKKAQIGLDPLALTQKINHEHAVILDIRDSTQFRVGHIIHAQQMNASDLMSSSHKKIEKYKNKPIVIVCVNGVESQKIAASLQKAGYNSFSLAGGINAWRSQGMPLVK